MRLKINKKANILMFIVVPAMCVIAMVAAFFTKPADSAAPQVALAPAKGMPVSVSGVESQSRPVVIRAHGDTRPLWQTTLRAQVDGQIEFIDQGLQAGNLVKRGQVMVRLAKRDFVSQVAEAKSRLAAAEVTLFREEREVKEAKRNWQRSGLKGKPESPLVLRDPQLIAAKAELEAARAALKAADARLSHTVIRAPFDGVILKRDVNPGESLFVGDEVASLYSMDTMEIRIQLNTDQWALLPEPLLGSPVTVTAPQQPGIWEARVVRQGRSLSQESRLRTLFLHVQQPLGQSPPLLPGTFVQTEMQGREIDGLLGLPEAALTKAGQVWFVDPTNRLLPRHMEAVFFENGLAYVRTQAEIKPPLRVAVHPNSSFTSGLLIQPLTEGKEG